MHNDTGFLFRWLPGIDCCGRGRPCPEVKSATPNLCNALQLQRKKTLKFRSVGNNIKPEKSRDTLSESFNTSLPVLLYIPYLRIYLFQNLTSLKATPRYQKSRNQLKTRIKKRNWPWKLEVIWWLATHYQLYR